MELVKLLSKVVKENINTKKILLEYPESTIKRLLDKFSQQTDENEEQIRKTIADFERFKGSFATEEKNELKQLNDELKNLDPSSEEHKNLSVRIRDLNKTVQDTLDIFKYDYDRLKSLTSEKETKQKSKKDFEGLVQDYVQKYKGTDLQLTKLNIKKFFEIKTHFPQLKEFKKEITSYTPSELNSMVGKYFSRFNNQGINELVAAITQKFHEENPDEDAMTAFLPRARRFVKHFELVPINSKLSKFMNFEEFEHIVDGYTPMEESEYSVPEIDTSDVEIPYEDDDVLIFAPDQKHKCINIRKKHAPDRRWCTSQEGSSNWYYNYRLTHNLTLYYIINKKLKESDLNYASVILVDKYGDMRLADGSNSGRYGGGTTIPWSEILSKIPVLRGKENYLEPKPYSDEEMQKLNRYKQYNLKTTDPIAELGSEEEVDLWMELRSPDFRNMTNGDVIFGNLPEDMQKKYIGLGNELSGAMVKNLSPSAMSYYVSKKKEKLLQKSLRELSDNDIQVILSNEMKPYLKSLKEKFKKEVVENVKQKIDFVTVSWPNDINAKFVKLFELDEFFEILPKDIQYLQIDNTTNDGEIFEIPESLGEFTELQTLVFENSIKELPESIGKLTKLQFLNLTNNQQMTRIPDSLVNLVCITWISVMNTPIDVKTISPEIKKYIDTSGAFWEINYPPEMRKGCIED